jgi:spore germination protein YaaH
MFVLAFLLLLIPGAPVHAQNSSFEVSGWIPYWSAEKGTEDVLAHIEQLTAVHPFGFTMGRNGELYDAAGLSGEPWVSFIASAKEKKVRVIPTIMWNDAEAMHRILSNKNARAKLVEDIASAVETAGWDGIDIDFENKKPATKDYFSSFLRELYARMGNKWVYCTIEARTPLESRYVNNPPDPARVQYANDLVEIQKYCDRVQVMTYDQGGSDTRLNLARPAPYKPLADPVWVEKVMKLISETIPKKKLVLGIPTYGYEYEIVPQVRDGHRYNLLWAFNPAHAQDVARAYGITPKRNSAGEMSFVYRPKTARPSENINPVPEARSERGVMSSIYSQAAIAGELVQPEHLMWWSDARAIGDKVEIAKKLGLRGVAIFKFDGGEDQGIWSILK